MEISSGNVGMVPGNQMATGAKTCKECQEQQAELLPLDSTNRQSKEHVSQLLSGVGDAVTADKRG